MASTALENVFEAYSFDASTLHWIDEVLILDVEQTQNGHAEDEISRWVNCLVYLGSLEIFGIIIGWIWIKHEALSQQCLNNAPPYAEKHQEAYVHHDLFCLLRNNYESISPSPWSNLFQHCLLLWLNEAIKHSRKYDHHQKIQRKSKAHNDPKSTLLAESYVMIK